MNKYNQWADDNFDECTTENTVIHFGKKQTFITVPENAKQLIINAIMPSGAISGYIGVEINPKDRHHKDGKILLELEVR